MGRDCDGSSEFFKHFPKVEGVIPGEIEEWGVDWRRVGSEGLPNGNICGVLAQKAC
ncbi:MAG: hypothetical protein RL215_2347 [Planctomycetota bacterium]